MLTNVGGIARRGVGAVPGRLCVGENRDEGLLCVKDPCKGDENGLEELSVAEVSNASFDGFI